MWIRAAGFSVSAALAIQDPPVVAHGRECSGRRGVGSQHQGVGRNMHSISTHDALTNS